MIDFTDNYFFEIIDPIANRDQWQQYWLPKNGFPIVGVQVQSLFAPLGLMWTSIWTWLSSALTATWNLTYEFTWNWIEFIY